MKLRYNLKLTPDEKKFTRK